jgi:polar amino acid transport system permease protein
LIATVSTLVVFGAIALAVVSAPGWPSVRTAFFNRTRFRESFPEILSQFLTNVRVFIIVEAAVLALGLVVALLRILKGPVFLPFRVLATVYTDVFRGVPTLLIVYLFGFGVPPTFELDRPWNSPVLWGGVALTLNMGAFVAEVFRSAIESVHQSQLSAARSLGLTQMQAYRYVVVPQAVRRVIPPLISDSVALLQSTALISSLGVIEGLRTAQIDVGNNFNFTAYVAAAVIFLCLTIPLARLADWLVRRQRTDR